MAKFKFTEPGYDDPLDLEGEELEEAIAEAKRPAVEVLRKSTKSIMGVSKVEVKLVPVGTLKPDAGGYETTITPMYHSLDSFMQHLEAKHRMVPRRCNNEACGCHPQPACSHRGERCNHDKE